MDLSVIVPCYNSGVYLMDALDSISNSKNLSRYSYEIIIVDDGSTSAQTLELLSTLSQRGYTIIRQNNAGPGAARNAGMKVACGDFLLFLDSDNKVKPEFVDVGIQTVKDRQVDMVYGKPVFFGETSKARFQTGTFNLKDILRGNYIDTCSIIKRSVWDETGGFDESPIVIGYEDWEFWIRLGSKGYKIHFIDQELFDYRVTKDSLILSKNDLENRQVVLRYIYTKHLDLIIKIYEDTFYEKIVYENDRRRPFRSFIKFIYLKYFKKDKAFR